MLCLECEQSISRWEEQTQRTLFPKRSSINLPLEYGSWLYLFAISISWRALAFLKHATKNPYIQIPAAAEQLLPSLQEIHHEKADEALARWGAVLREETSDADPFHQNLIFLNGENVPNEHSQVVGFTVFETCDAVGVFSQLGPICILGAISQEDPTNWHGAQIQPQGGCFPIASQAVPESFANWLSNYFQKIKELEL